MIPQLDPNHPDFTEYSERLLREYQRHCGLEDIERVELTPTSALVLTTELGMYRLAQTYPTRLESKGFSKNLGHHYVRIGL